MTLFRDDDEAGVVSLVTDRVVIPVDFGGLSSGVGDGCGGIGPCSVGIGCCGVAVVDSEAKEVEISVVGGISRGCCGGIGCGAGGGVEVVLVLGLVVGVKEREAVWMLLLLLGWTKLRGLVECELVQWLAQGVWKKAMLRWNVV
jgi:hypothetical protein